MKRAARTDQNHVEIVRALRAIHCSVQSLAAVGGGVADLLVQRGGRTWLIEVKAPKGKLTEAQRAWHQQFTVYVARSPEEAIAVVTEGAR